MNTKKTLALLDDVLSVVIDYLFRLNKTEQGTRLIELQIELKKIIREV